jgi:hypothetical protein
MRSSSSAPSLALWCAVVLLSAPAGAQSRNGSLTGSTVDANGSPLAGVHLILTGAGAPLLQVTNAQGELRFLDLAPGSYRLTAALEGFAGVEVPNVVIESGRETRVRITLLPAALPLLDDGRLSAVETAGPAWVYRDPAATGAYASGGPGDAGSSMGVQPSLDAVDAYREGAGAGGAAEVATRGGTNEWRAEGRFSFLGDRLESGSALRRADLGRDYDGPGPVREQPPLLSTNRVTRQADSGGEIGGPLLRDRFWLWSAYGRRDADMRTASGPGSPDGATDSALITTLSLKLDARLGAGDSATLLATHADVQRYGLGAGPTRPQETSWIQTYTGREPTDLRLDEIHVFNPRLYAEGRAEVAETGTVLMPEGGLSALAYLDGDEVWHRTFLLHQAETKERRLAMDVALSTTGGGLRHDLTLGAGDDRKDDRSLSTWAGGGLIYAGASYFGSAGDVLALSRAAKPSFTQQAAHASAQDTMARGDLVLTLGLVYDRQEAANRQSSVAANPLYPDLLPAAADGGGRPAPLWTSLSPQIALAWAPGRDKTTVLHAGWSRSSEPMTPEVATWLNPLATQGYLYLSPYLLGFASPNVDPRSGRPVQSNAVAAGLQAPHSDELRFAVDHAVRQDFVVGLDLTYRRTAGLLHRQLLVFDDPDPFCAACLGTVGRPDRPDDYTATSVSALLPDGRQVTLPYSQLRPGVSSRLGTLLANGGGVQEVRGAALRLDKRLTNRWALHGRFTWADRRWSSVPGSADSTLTVAESLPRRSPRAGDAVLQGTGADWLSPEWTSGTFLDSRWSYSLQSQIHVAPDRPWGFDVLLGLNGREGSPVPYYVLVTLPANMQYERIRLQATGRPDSVRLDDVHTLDLRLEEEVIRGDVRLTLGLDAFNLADQGTVLQRQPRLDIGTSNHVLRVGLPRTFQLGARLAFR